MMRHSWLVALLTCVAGAARAQGSSADSAAAACRDTAVAGSYARCSLWLDGGWVRQGPGRLVVAKNGFLKPIQLAALVQGDSARSYALVYERDDRRARKVWFTGLALELAAVIALHADDCRIFNFGRCSGRSDGRTIVGGTLLLASLGTVFKSSKISRSAYYAETKAIWWHNARFAR